VQGIIKLFVPGRQFADPRELSMLLFTRFVTWQKSARVTYKARNKEVMNIDSDNCLSSAILGT
jgi:hypothetical protein